MKIGILLRAKKPSDPSNDRHPWNEESMLGTVCAEVQRKMIVQVIKESCVWRYPLLDDAGLVVGRSFLVPGCRHPNHPKIAQLGGTALSIGGSVLGN
jgi:hypothetical protein